MKQPGVLVVLITFVAAVSFVVASEQYKNGSMKTTQLTGLNEVQSFGDPDGTGIFKFTINAEENKICYELSVSNIGAASEANISSGTRDMAGPVLVTLQPPAKGLSKDCVNLDPDKIADLVRNPGNYYVNVQNAEFPNGAIRGQLGK